MRRVESLIRIAADMVLGNIDNRIFETIALLD